MKIPQTILLFALLSLFGPAAWAGGSHYTVRPGALRGPLRRFSLMSKSFASKSRLDKLQARLPAFKHRNYRLFFGGQLFSLIGTWMQSVAQAWLVYRLTGSAVLLGLVAFANQVPVLFLSPLSGTLADRTSRYRIFLGTQVCAMALAFGLAGLTLAGRVELWHLFTLAALLGVVNAFDLPARQAFVVELVGRENLGNAIALNSSLFNGARVAGPVLAGLLVATLGEGWCFFVNGISYLPLIAALLGMELAPRAREGPNGSPWRDLVDGFRFAARTGPVRALLLLLGLASLTAIPYMVLMPIFADQILGSGPRGLGILMAASGVGALAGAISLAARRKMDGLAIGVAVAATGFGIALLLFALSRTFWLSVALLAPAGFFMVRQLVSSNTLIQAMVPDALRGRVMAIYSMTLMGLAPFGALLAGLLAHHFGAPTAVIFGGVSCLAGAALFWMGLPTLHLEARRLILSQERGYADHPERNAIPRPPSSTY